MKKAEEKRLFRRRAAGFTIIELLVVISIMAVIATLVTGAAIRSVKQSRRKKIDVMVRVLENGLVAYRTQENEWPFTATALVRDPKQFDRVPRYWAHTKDNYKVFEKMLMKMATQKVSYFDPSALLVRGGSLRDAISNGRYNQPLGYPDPDDSNKFRYFCVEYNALSDSVKVHWRNVPRRTHREGSWMNMQDDSFPCPDPEMAH